MVKKGLKYVYVVIERPLTGSMNYKKQVIRNTSKVSEKNKKQTLVSAAIIKKQGAIEG